MFTTDGNRKSSQSEVISVPITLEKERHNKINASCSV